MTSSLRRFAGKPIGLPSLLAAGRPVCYLLPPLFAYQAPGTREFETLFKFMDSYPRMRWFSVLQWSVINQGYSYDIFTNE